jgi:tetratricopeptide (TPR) repeat protein
MAMGEGWQAVTQVVGTITIAGLALWACSLALQRTIARYAEFRVRRMDERRSGEVQVEQSRRWMEGHRSREQAVTHMLSKRFADALPHFDAAIAAGHADAETLGHRAQCLHALGFSLDAIDDLNQSIALEPNDSNSYFLRSLSKSAVGDLEGAVADLELAVRVATVANEFQRSHDAGARELGHASASEMFAARLPIARMQVEANQKDERFRAEHPELPFRKTLAETRRSNARRRAPLPA